MCSNSLGAAYSQTSIGNFHQLSVAEPLTETISGPCKLSFGNTLVASFLSLLAVDQAWWGEAAVQGSAAYGGKHNQGPERYGRAARPFAS